MFSGIVVDAKKGPASIEQPLGELFHVSSIVLVDGKDGERVKVSVKTPYTDEFVIAILQKGVTDNVSVDLFVNIEQEAQFQVSGKSAVVHVTGFFEPEGEDMDFDSDDEEREMTQEELESMKAMGFAPEMDGSSDTESDAPALQSKPNEADSESEVDADDLDALRKRIEEAESESDEESEQPAPTPTPTKKRPAKTQEAQPTKKKAVEGKKGQPEAKPKSALKKTTNGDEGAFMNSLKEFVAKKGKVKIGQLGIAVKKPQSIPLKLKAFLNQHAETFKVEGEFVTLK